jgi:hypothetical protein
MAWGVGGLRHSAQCLLWVVVGAAPATGVKVVQSALVGSEADVELDVEHV